MAEKPFLWSAMKLPFTRKWIADLDDKVGNGKINPVKKWWWDLDTDEEGNIVPAKRINARELEFRSMQPKDQKLACYPLETVPTPIEVQPSSPDRKQGVEFYRAAVSPQAYRDKLSAGDPPGITGPAWAEESTGNDGGKEYV